MDRALHFVTAEAHKTICAAVCSSLASGTFLYIRVPNSLTLCVHQAS